MTTSPTRRTCEHVAALYETDQFLADRVAAFIAEGLAGGEQVIVLATHSNWKTITARLTENGIDFRRAGTEKRLLMLDATDVLEGFTLGGRVTVEGFRAVLRRFIDPGVRQRMYGGLVSLLAERGDVDSAIALESLGHQLAHEHDIPVLCGYRTTGRHLSADAIASIAAAHDHTSFERPSAASQPRGGDIVAEHTCSHAVRFYENRESLARIVGQFLGEGFVAGLPAIVIATPEHLAAIEDVLASRYFDLARLRSAGDLITVDAGDMLSRVMRDGMPDAARFRESMIPLIEQACRGRTDCVIRAYGEMVDVLWKDGQTAAAIRLEVLWNQLAQTHSFALLCGYSIGQFYKDARQHDVERHHTHRVADSGERVRLH